MGATATAIANMQALTRRHGPAPQAFVVVPIVGAFFVDLMNLAVLTFFLLRGGIEPHVREHGDLFFRDPNFLSPMGLRTKDIDAAPARRSGIPLSYSISVDGGLAP